MRIDDLIRKKRDGRVLTRAELEYLIDGYTAGEVPDYQLAAWAMAVYFQGMEAEEIGRLTEIMANSGDRLDLDQVPGIKVDKHSTGGVGDTTTLVLAPLVAACGVPLAKMSGRGLGYTGGTIDKLDSIPELRTSLTKEEFITNLMRDQVAVAGRLGNLAPADKKLYALRDVTATVESIPLIVSSIMSKKLAGGADSLLLDVKVGSGAFMKELSSARKLARRLVEIGRQVGQQTRAVISAMNQPLGYAVGNALEVKEAIATLKGVGPADLTELCLTLGTELLLLAEAAATRDAARAELETALETGQAREKFRTMIANQGGRPEVVAKPELLPQAEYTSCLTAEQAGYIHRIGAESVGLSALVVGAGREKKGSTIDPGVGIELAKKVGAEVAAGDRLATLHYNDPKLLSEAETRLTTAFQIKDEPPPETTLIHRRID